MSTDTQTTPTVAEVNEARDALTDARSMLARAVTVNYALVARLHRAATNPVDRAALDYILQRADQALIAKGTYDRAYEDWEAAA